MARYRNGEEANLRDLVRGPSLYRDAAGQRISLVGIVCAILAGNTGIIAYHQIEEVPDDYALPDSRLHSLAAGVMQVFESHNKPPHYVVTHTERVCLEEFLPILTGD